MFTFGVTMGTVDNFALILRIFPFHITVSRTSGLKEFVLYDNCYNLKDGDTQRF